MSSYRRSWFTRIVATWRANLVVDDHAPQIGEENVDASMKRAVGSWTVRFARGVGRQSGILGINALLLAALPFLDLVRPACVTADCAQAWDRLLFLPRILYLPMMSLGLVLLGSWIGQRRHAKVRERFETSRDLRAEAPEAPPGSAPTRMLDRDLARRTLRGLSLGALAATAALAPFTLTAIARRRCDPWPIRNSGLQVCQDSLGWADMLVAYEVWGLLVASMLASLLWYTRSTAIPRPTTLESPRPRRIPRRARWDMA